MAKATRKVVKKISIPKRSSPYTTMVYTYDGVTQQMVKMKVPPVIDMHACMLTAFLVGIGKGKLRLATSKQLQDFEAFYENYFSGEGRLQAKRLTDEISNKKNP